MKIRPSMDASVATPASPDRQILTPGELRPSVVAFRNEALLSPLISIGRNGLIPTKAVRSQGALRLHPAFNDLKLWAADASAQRPKAPYQRFLERCRAAKTYWTACADAFQNAGAWSA